MLPFRRVRNNLSLWVGTMRIVARIAVAAIAAAVGLNSAVAQTVPTTSASQPSQGRTQNKQSAAAKEVLTDAATIAVIIAASIASYKAMGKPCACPEDAMCNGRKCGSSSAWARAGGYRPLCYPGDVTASMIDAYRATKATPHLK